MLARLGQVICWATCFTAMLASSSLAATDDIPQALAQDIQCMSDVLHTEPGVQSQKMGHDQGQVFLEYGVTNKDGQSGTVRFYAEKDRDARGHYAFQATLSGLSTPGKEPDDWGTNNIVRHWKTVCGVIAFVLYV